MHVTNLANRSPEPRHAQARNVRVQPAARPSGDGESAGSRGPPFVIAVSIRLAISGTKPSSQVGFTNLTKELMKLKEVLQAVVAGSRNQISAFDSKTGWSTVDSPLSPCFSSPPVKRENVMREIGKTHEPFWSSTGAFGDEGIIIYRPLHANRKEWLAQAMGRTVDELVLLSNFASAMEFTRLYGPMLMSIPYQQSVTSALDGILDCLWSLKLHGKALADHWNARNTISEGLTRK